MQDRFSGRQHVIGARLPQPLLIDVARRSLLCGLQVRRCHRQAHEWLFRPEQPFVSLAVAPPHLQTAEQAAARDIYEQRLREAGADHVLPTTEAILHWEGAAG